MNKSFFFNMYFTINNMHYLTKFNFKVHNNLNPFFVLKTKFYSTINITEGNLKIYKKSTLFQQ